tara:strand:- start:264 stop:893 length:630 start_codon:yes stop_codon:yes gene_type:complete
MSRKEIDPVTASQIKKELAELRAELENNSLQRKKNEEIARDKQEKKKIFQKLTNQVRVVENELQNFTTEYFSVQAGTGDSEGANQEFEKYVKKLDVDKPRKRSRWKSIEDTISKRQSSGYVKKKEDIIQSVSFGFMLDLLEPILDKYNQKLTALLKLIIIFRNNLVAHGDIDFDEIDLVDLKLLQFSCSVAVGDLEELQDRDGISSLSV